MNLETAIEVLEQHNKWRCDNSVPSVHEATDQKKLTESINVIVSDYFSKNKKL